MCAAHTSQPAELAFAEQLYTDTGAVVIITFRRPGAITLAGAPEQVEKASAWCIAAGYRHDLPPQRHPDQSACLYHYLSRSS